MKDRPLVKRSMEIGDVDVLRSVLGRRDENLHYIEKRFSVDVAHRGSLIGISGDEAYVILVERIIEELAKLAAKKREFDFSDIDSIAANVAPGSIPVEVLYDDIILVTPRRKPVTPKGETQKKYVDAMRVADMVFSIGPAGTGKTYLAVALAISALNEQKVQRIVLTRPAVEAGEKLGFLPGNLAEKVDPYLRPLYDALYEMMEYEKVMRFIDKGIIEIAPLAFMRGRTLNNAFVIMDEAQNTTTEQMKMFLTRLGFNSRAVITGDVTQVDLPKAQISGLVEVQQVLKDVDAIKFIRFTEKDVVRHPLVQDIIRAYETYNEGKK